MAYTTENSKQSGALTSNKEIIGKLNVWIRHFGSGVGIRNESTRMRILEDLRVAVVALSPVARTADQYLHRLPSARDFVRRTLLLMNQRADTDVIDQVARQICKQLAFLDGKLKPRYDCGYGGCEDLTGIPHGHN